MASANNSMNKLQANFMKDDQDQNNSQQLDGAPSWMLPFFAKMKAEIKKEIMEEVMTLISKSHKKSKDKVSIDKIFEEIYCDHCDQLIVGVRYKCGNCEDFDLCQDCESIPNVHDPSHIFLKIRYPLAVKCKHKKNKNHANQGCKKLDSSLLAKELVEHRIEWCLPDTPRPYDAHYMGDETFPDSSVVAPSTKFIKRWRVLNSGTKPWTNEVKLRCLRGTKLVPESYLVSVPPLKPGKAGVVSVSLSTPSKPGVYQCYWQFHHNNIAFGHHLWCKVQVQTPNGDKKTNKKDVQKNEPHWNELFVPFIIAANDQAKGNLPRKRIVSHTATPNNTPFDLTPPKSPDHHDTSAKEIAELSNNIDITHSKSNQGSDDDDCSILSISTDSETEFVVIPRPKCFNLSESFVSHQFSHLSPHLNSKSLTSENTKCLENVECEKNNSANQPSTQGNNSQMPNTSGPVSQETGVPELAENVVETILEVVQEENQENPKKIFVSHLSADGSSSEISIIESEDNSPVIENITQTIDTLSITVSDDNIKQDISQNNTSNEDKRINSQVEQKEIENESSDIPSNATFPKYPIEGICESETFVPKDEERTIQVLPDSLVTGALGAAASLYNAAKAVISTMQQPHNEKDTCLSRDLPVIRNQEDDHNPVQNIKLSSMEHLIEMGFCNRQQNEQLLKKHQGDLAAVVAELVSLNDNEWYESRHSSQSAD